MRPAAALVLALPLALAACGGGSSSSTTSSPEDMIKSATQKTVAAGGEHLVLTVTGGASGTRVSLHGAGDFDSKTRKGALHISLSAGSLATNVVEVLSGTDAYIQSPLFSAFLPAGKKWLKLDLTKLGTTAGIDLSALSTQDPTNTLKALESVKSVKKVGTEQVAGVSTTHYTAVIDRSKLPESLQSVVAGGTEDVWVGDDGYVRRVRVRTASSQTETVTVTSDLSGFGKTVTVTIPAASETLDAGGKIPGLGG
jgi:hypothetical protein